MRRQHRLYNSVILNLFTLLVLVGCAVNRPKVLVKNGQEYCVISAKTWKGRWWDYYERGRSCTEGGFWDEARADFQSAIELREDDKRNARTYGLHFIDYFPHRELGIVYYRLGYHSEAIHELETSLDTVETAKSKFYLNKARKSLLDQTQQDNTPPRIVLDGPRDGLLTNRFTVMVEGQAEDDTYVAAITINGHKQFIELAESRISFRKEINLRDGANTVDVFVHDLVGRQAHRRITVHLDRHGPTVSVDKVELVGTPQQQRVRVHGFLADRSRITRFVLAGIKVPLPLSTSGEFIQEVSISTGMTNIPFEVDDAAGNTTRGDIAMTSPTSGLVRVDKPTYPLLARLAYPNPAVVVSDIGALLVGAQLAEQRRDIYAPVIKLQNLVDQETIYDDSLYLEVKVTDANGVAAFHVNGESVLKNKGTQTFFAQFVELKPGENSILLEANDEAGNTSQLTIVVNRKIRLAKQVGTRLRVSLFSFEKKGSTSERSDALYDILLNALVNQRRFNFVERETLDKILAELKLSQTELVDPATVAKTGKIMAAEGILIGTVIETERAIDVFIRFVDVEEEVILASADVYSEDKTIQGLKTLMAGLAWKLRQQFPLVEGLVIDKEGKVLLTSLSESHGVKPHMKLVIFRAGEEVKHPRTGRILQRSDIILGEARITEVSKDLCEVKLLSLKQPGEDVQELDKVITK